MSMKEMLLNDFKTAMREKNVIKKDTIQVIRAGILQIEKDKKIEVDDSIILDIISKELKKRKDVLPDYEKSGNTNAVLKINSQIEILTNYLPKQLSEDELKIIISNAINDIDGATMKDMGKIMGLVLPQVKGRADGKLVNSIIKNLL